jgi:hypothetical protein
MMQNKDGTFSTYECKRTSSWIEVSFYKLLLFSLRKIGTFIQLSYLFIYILLFPLHCIDIFLLIN